MEGRVRPFTEGVCGSMVAEGKDGIVLVLEGFGRGLPDARETVPDKAGTALRTVPTAYQLRFVTTAYSPTELRPRVHKQFCEHQLNIPV